MAGEEDAQPPPSTKIAINNPFYLGAHDRPGDFITSTRLNLDNFDTWSHAIFVALSSRRKFGFLDGTITGPVQPATKDDWVVVQCMLVSWLMNTIDPEVRSMLSNYDNAKRLWDDLHERFGVVNGPRIQRLKSQINKCEQSKNMSVAIYFGKLKHEKRREDDMLQQFLLGLYPDSYAQIRSTILAQDPLPSLNKAYQQVSQEELVRGIDRVKDDPPPAVGFSVRVGGSRGRGSADNSSSDRPVCSHCKKPGHLASNCYSLQVCTHCHKRGHDVRRCFEIVGYPEGWATGDRARKPHITAAVPGRGVARANAAAGSYPSPVHSNSAPPSSNGQVFTADQWKAITGFFGNTNIPENRLSGPNEGDDWNGS